MKPAAIQAIIRPILLKHETISNQFPLEFQLALTRHLRDRINDKIKAFEPSIWETKVYLVEQISKTLLIIFANNLHYEQNSKVSKAKMLPKDHYSSEVEQYYEKLIEKFFSELDSKLINSEKDQQTPNIEAILKEFFAEYQNAPEEELDGEKAKTKNYKDKLSDSKKPASSGGKIINLEYEKPEINFLLKLIDYRARENLSFQQNYPLHFQQQVLVLIYNKVKKVIPYLDQYEWEEMNAILNSLINKILLNFKNESKSSVELHYTQSVHEKLDGIFDNAVSQVITDLHKIKYYSGLESNKWEEYQRVTHAIEDITQHANQLLSADPSNAQIKGAATLDLVSELTETTQKYYFAESKSQAEEAKQIIAEIETATQLYMSKSENIFNQQHIISRLINGSMNIGKTQNKLFCDSLSAKIKELVSEFSPDYRIIVDCMPMLQKLVTTAKKYNVPTEQLNPIQRHSLESELLEDINYFLGHTPQLLQYQHLGSNLLAPIISEIIKHNNYFNQAVKDFLTSETKINKIMATAPEAVEKYVRALLQRLHLYDYPEQNFNQILESSFNIKMQPAISDLLRQATAPKSVDGHGRSRQSSKTVSNILKAKYSSAFNKMLKIYYEYHYSQDNFNMIFYDRFASEIKEVIQAAKNTEAEMKYKHHLLHDFVTEALDQANKIKVKFNTTVLRDLSTKIKTSPGLYEQEELLQQLFPQMLEKINQYLRIEGKELLPKTLEQMDQDFTPDDSTLEYCRQELHLICNSFLEKHPDLQLSTNQCDELFNLAFSHLNKANAELLASMKAMTINKLPRYKFMRQNYSFTQTLLCECLTTAHKYNYPKMNIKRSTEEELDKRLKKVYEQFSQQQVNKPQRKTFKQRDVTEQSITVSTSAVEATDHDQAILTPSFDEIMHQTYKKHMLSQPEAEDTKQKKTKNKLLKSKQQQKPTPTSTRISHKTITDTFATAAEQIFQKGKFIEAPKTKLEFRSSLVEIINKHLDNSQISTHRDWRSKLAVFAINAIIFAISIPLKIFTGRFFSIKTHTEKLCESLKTNLTGVLSEETKASKKSSLKPS